MTVYDHAHQLARALAGSQEYQDFSGAWKKLAAKPESQKALAEWRDQSLQLELARLSGQEPPPQKLEEVEALGRVLMANPSVNDYLQAEFRLSRLVADLQKIILDAVPEWVTAQSPDEEKDL